MRATIAEELTKIEAQHAIKVLYACESGSRAWGFPSRDSDYDVRFLFVYPFKQYLSLEHPADVIEAEPAPALDFAGWELKKALKLFQNSNPPLLEWLHSPIVYLQQFDTIRQMRQLKSVYYSPKTCVYHYLHMAENNYREYLRKDSVRVKKYFYVLRPLFCCRWIEATNTTPPMEFRELFKYVKDRQILDAVEQLLQKKLDGEELSTGPRIECLNSYIEKDLAHFQKYVKTVPHPKVDQAILNDLFRSTLSEVWGQKPA